MATKEESAPSGSFCECKNLDPAEKDQAVQHAAPAALSFTKSYARTGAEAELTRRPGAVFWSGLAAGWR